MPNNNTKAKTVRPFLKWAGNKYSILDRIIGLLPKGDRLVEPFLGSGAVFLNTDYDKYLLTDSNADLINLYQILKEEGPDFTTYCKRFFTGKHNTPEVYYRRRDEFNKIDDPRKKSALFLYLNRHGYNGLCRYNKKGGFNVPFGRYKKPYFPTKEMQHFHTKSQHAEIQHAEFNDVMASTRKGDVIYCDPPYVPLSTSAHFTCYSAGGFNLEQQKELAALARQTMQRDIPVLISNHNTPFTLKTYRGAEIKRFKVRRNISCNAQKREDAGELLALFS